jgi:hypothetical protein
MKHIFGWAAAVVLAADVMGPSVAEAELRAGAALVNVVPKEFPVLVNGGMTSRSATKVTTPVHARALVLDDGTERLAIVVVDSCMMPRDLLDDAKALAATRTKIKPERMLISATHTHTAPSCMGALGTDADSNYVPFLREKLAEAVAAAEKNLEPARVGWAVTQAPEYTALRRWIRRPDRVADDPFGNPTVRANMHAGRVHDDVVGESGPEDPDLSLISFRSPDGRPIAVLANFSMHYFSGPAPLSADYFGLFAEGLKERIAESDENDKQPFVGIMSHGCSGDIWRKDYKNVTPSKVEQFTIEQYAAGLVDLAAEAYAGIESHADADLAMAEQRLHLKYRVPDRQRLEWARRVVEELGDRPPKTQEEVYARDQLMLHERQSTDVVVQALRIGEIAIATTPNETYALSGLKVKLQSPLRQTMVIELANGGDGYIPPPEQHLIGGYNTWAARSAGLEVEAEPKIVETALRLVEYVARKPRQVYRQGRGPACEAILAAKPAGYWRLDEFAGPRAEDSSGHNRDGIYEPSVAYFLEGPASDAFCAGGETNRAVHFTGDRLQTQIPELGDRYSVSLWFWNGMPADARDVTGWMASRGRAYGLGPHGDHLGIAGQGENAGKLIFLHGDGTNGSRPAIGRTALERWTWNHAVLVRNGKVVQVYLNGNEEPEIEITTNADFPPGSDTIFFGGRCDDDSNWEGRLDEIAVFDRELTPEEIKSLAR